MGVNRYERLADAIETALQGQKQSLCQEKFDFFEQERVLTTPGYTAYTRIGDG